MPTQKAKQDDSSVDVELIIAEARTMSSALGKQV